MTSTSENIVTKKKSCGQVGSFCMLCSVVRLGGEGKRAIITIEEIGLRGRGSPWSGENSGRGFVVVFSYYSCILPEGDKVTRRNFVNASFIARPGHIAHVGTFGHPR